MKRLAQDIIDYFSSSPVKGRAMLGADAAALLMECVAETDGDYIEIGSATGGSAIMAGVAMNHVPRPGNIFCIDMFAGNNELQGPDIYLQSFWMNILKFSLQQRTVAFKQHHPPFPVSIWYRAFSVGLIDGCHIGEAPLMDFKVLDERVTNYLLFDNVESEAVSAAVDKATQDNGNWEEYKSIEYVSTIEKETIFSEDKMVKFVALRRKR